MNRNQILLEVVSGLGESLVSGQVTPDQFLFERTSTEVKFISQSVSPQTAESNTQVISQEVATEIVNLAIRVEEESGGIPQDIEFAYEGGTVWLLQSRPITTIQKGNSGNWDLLSNRNTREVIPNPMTYMSWSAFFEVIQGGLQRRYANRKVDYFAICKRENRGFYEIRRGYLYQNLTVTDELTRAEFGAGYEDTLLKSFTEIPEELFKACCNNSSPGISKQISGALGLLNYLRKATGQVQETYYLIDLYRTKFGEFMSWTEFQNWSLQKLYDEFGSVQDEFTGFGGVVIESQIYLELLATIVQGLIRHYCGKYKTNTTCFNELLVGLGGIISHQMNLQLSQVLQTASKDPGIIEYIKTQETADNPYQNWKQDLKETETKKLLEKFLNQFGHRAVTELEVSSPRWGNNPSYIFSLISVAANGEYSQHMEDETLTTARLELEKDLIGSCGFYMRPILRWAIGKLQEFIRFRENLKDIIIRFIARQQQILLAIAHKWNATNFLRLEDGDIFHLSVSQLRSIVDGSLSARNAVALVNYNKKLHSVYARVRSPPKIFVGKRIEKTVQTADGVEFEGGLKYLGCAGASGSATGEAVIIPTLEDVCLLSQCKSKTRVLVTSVTDPAWTPLFLQVDAVVVETGGILSHAAIVAREFGIPCVFGISNLLSLTRTGDFILVDGDNGFICVNKNGDSKAE